MANPYTSVSITGYNKNPPPDDSTRSSSNLVSWSKHKTKLTDPLKDAIGAINSNVNSAFASMDSRITTIEDENTSKDDSAASVYMSSDQAASGGVWTKVALDSVVYDEGSNFETGNNRYLAPTTGKYLVTAGFRSDNLSSGDDVWAAIYVNGSVAFYLTHVETKATAEGTQMSGAAMLSLSKNDAVTLFGNVEGGTGFKGGSSSTWMQIIRVW